MKTETEHQTENQAPLTGEAKQRDIALRQFRAYLHLAITARQCGRDTEFAALPGPKALTYCLALAKVPEDVLAIEVSQPVRALLYQIEQVAAVCEGRLTGPDPAKAAAAQPVLDALDLALATILAELTWFVKRRAAVTTCKSLLEHVLYFWLFDDGGQMAESLRRHTQLHWADDREKDGSIAPGSLPEDFARDVFARVATLDRWVESFPDHVRPAAESLPAWPLLAYRHTDRRARVDQLSERLNLGAASLVDTRATAAFDPDAPLVRYLLALIPRLEDMRAQLGDATYSTIKIEQAMLLQIWFRWPEPPPEEPVLAPLRRARQLPELTRATAGQWAREVVVPLLLATDARDPLHITHPDLQAFAHDLQAADPHIFQTCLLTAVETTLSQLLRPD